MVLPIELPPQEMESTEPGLIPSLGGPMGRVAPPEPQAPPLLAFPGKQQNTLKPLAFCSVGCSREEW